MLNSANIYLVSGRKMKAQLPKRYIPLLLLGLLPVWYVVQADDGASVTVTERVLPTVSTTQARSQAWQPNLIVHGSWQASEESALGSSLAGLRIERVLVEVGAKVKAGQLLALLEQDVLQSQQAQAEAAWQRARANELLVQVKEQEARRALERGKQLRPSGALSGQDFDTLQANWQATQAQWTASVAETRQALAQKQEAAIQLAKGTLRAPVAGVIVERQAVAGSLVDSEQPLFRLMHGDTPEFIARVSATQLPQIKAGQAVDLLDGQGAVSWSGKVRVLASRLDEASGYGRLHIQITDAGHPLPLPGVAGSARIRLAGQQALLLDARAVRFDSAGEAFVMLVDATRHVHRRQIKVGEEANGRLPVLSGLKAGEQVVLGAAAMVNDGDQIRLVPSADKGPV